MPKRSTPKLVNRGAAGLLKKAPDAPGPTEKNGKPADPTVAVLADGYGKKNNIRCEGQRVKIASLTPDPDNARVHGDRNMESIKASLKLYGQMKPIVVRKQGRVVAAGNGTLRAATELGWTEIAASVVPMTDREFTGYALADNRTAELAAWDFEVVARLDKFLQEKGDVSVGWSADELKALRGEFDHGDAGNDQSADILARYAVYVPCETEADQLAMLELLTNQGITCQALTS